MISVRKRRYGTDGEMWFTDIDSEEWIWLYSVLPYRVQHDDLERSPGPSMQTESDLELATLPQYACLAPSAFFYPYVTYIVRNWFGRPFGPTFMIPREPLNRLEGRRWLASLRDIPIRLVHSPEGRPEYLREVMSVEAMQLGEIRYVYDESRRSRGGGAKTDVPSRHLFSASSVAFDATRDYLRWYIECFRAFFSRLLAIGKKDSAADRERCLLAGWTLNRLAVDAFIISTVDVPYVRKWQFFGFLDGVAALRNELQGVDHGRDAQTFQEMLGMEFFDDEIEPALARIPVDSVREEMLSHTRSIYAGIADMRIKGASGQDQLPGPELVRLLRNTQHGYTLDSPTKKELLLRHSGKIPDDLPDLVIALWHNVLLNFPFDGQSQQ